MSFVEEDVIPDILEDLIRAQNRGTDAVGFVVGDTRIRKPYKPWKKLGSAGSHFGRESEDKAGELKKRFPGNIGIGHNRYTTIGGRGAEDTQPHGFKHGGKSIVIASNGDIPQYGKLRDQLEELGCVFNGECDAEAIVNLLGMHMFEYGMSTIDAFAATGNMVKGAFSIVAMTPDGELVAMRDPWGIRPLFWSKNEKGAMIISEDALLDEYDNAFDRNGGGVQEVEPGTIVVITSDGKHTIHRYADADPHFCAMEAFYFSRPDSSYNGIFYNTIRYELGRQAAREWKEAGNIIPDIVVGFPFSGIPGAEGFADELGVKHRSGIIKDRSGGRMFMGDQMTRLQIIASNLTADRSVVNGKKVVGYDDSIFRGEQSIAGVNELYLKGASWIGMQSSAPPVKYPCRLGINTKDPNQLVAHGRTIEDVRRLIPHLDLLAYLSLEGFYEVMGNQGFCTGCFKGQKGYPVHVPLDGKEA